MNAKKDDIGKPELSQIPPKALGILLGGPAIPSLNLREGGAYSAILSVSKWYWNVRTSKGDDKIVDLQMALELLVEAEVDAEEVARVLEYGKRKYGTFNWLSGDMAYSRVVSAALRHLVADLDGEEKDAESGFRHLTHAACCIIFLMEYEKNGKAIDDRPNFVVHPEQRLTS